MGELSGYHGLLYTPALPLENNVMRWLLQPSGVLAQVFAKLIKPTTPLEMALHIVLSLNLSLLLNSTFQIIGTGQLRLWYFALKRHRNFLEVA